MWLVCAGQGGGGRTGVYAPLSCMIYECWQTGFWHGMGQQAINGNKKVVQKQC